MSTLLGKKIGMGRFYNDQGESIPVTLVHVDPCVITRLKTEETDKYSSVQIGYQDAKEKHLNKSQISEFKKNNIKPKRILKEFRVEAEELEQYEVGKELKVECFKSGDFIDINGVSKGRGFTGVMKRYGFKGSRSSHGQGGEYHRHGGSIGQCSYPARVFKGMKMPGQCGASKVTLQNLKVMDVDNEKDLLIIKGSVPGANGGILKISHAIKRKSANG